MYSRRFAGSGMARNFTSHSRSAWPERGEYPTSAAGFAATWSAPKNRDGNTRVNISTIAENGRMRLLFVRRVKLYLQAAGESGTAYGAAPLQPHLATAGRIRGNHGQHKILSSGYCRRAFSPPESWLCLEATERDRPFARRYFSP